MGIPSIIIDGLSRRDPKFLFNVYKMPTTDLVINKNNSFAEIIKSLEDDKYFKNKSNEVERWAYQFSEDYNSEIIAEIIDGKNSS